MIRRRLLLLRPLTCNPRPIYVHLETRSTILLRSTVHDDRERRNNLSYLDFRTSLIIYFRIKCILHIGYRKIPSICLMTIDNLPINKSYNVHIIYKLKVIFAINVE